MTKILKRPLSILLTALMIVGVFAALPISASAETITTVTNSNNISINSDTTITGTASNTKITVTGDCTIILDGLNLTNTSNRGKCGIDIQSGTVNLIIKGENKITAGGQNGDACPIGVRENATLIISGYNNENDGNILNVIGTTNGKAAIGGAWDQWTCGTIMINSGTINAKGGGYGAAVIGKGGSKNSTKSVTINGGVITTTLLDTQQGATAIGGGNMSVSYSPSYDTPLIMNGVTVYPTVTWMNYDGTELKKDEIVAEDTTPSYDGATPEKAEDDDYTYTFSGWTDGTNTYVLTDTLPVVTGNVTYTATYTANEKPVITWNNWDGTTFKSDHVNVGAVPSYDGETPTKDGVTFAGWTDSHGVFYAKDAVLPEVTADKTYTAVFELTIGSVDEWNSFAASVKGGNTYSGIIVRMTADVGPVTTMVDGTFSGTFDGDGHTLTVNISGGSTTAATFAYVKDATIQNLRLEGTVTSSGIHTAALVKSVSDNGSTCTIKNVDIYADVNCSQGYIGGFIGHAGVANTVNIENSIFAGSINKTGSTQGFIGAFIGWSQKLTATINNCAFTGSYNNINSFNNIGFSYNAPTKVTVSGFYSNASEVFVANVNHGTRLYVPSSSYPNAVALVKNNDGETLYSAFSDALATWTDGSTLALLADVTCDSLITVPAADTKTLDLNGNALSLSYSSTKVEVNGTLTIQSTASGGSITPTSKSRVINVVDGGTLNIESGTINGYNADRAVIGGVGTINFNGGKIVTPASNAFSPDGVATLNLNGGEIECTSGSTSMGTASAVWAHGDSTINWNGTAITTNTGDGIRMKSAGNGAVNVTGGSFTATSSSLPEEGGYAVYVNSNMSSLNLKGNPSFSGRGIYLTNDKVINITDELSNTNPISVTMQTPGVFTSGLSGNGDASNFANGNGTGYALTLNASGEAQIVSTYTITWNNWDDTELEKDENVTAGSTPTYDGATPEKAEDENYTYTFSGWSPAIAPVSANVTYTAQFTATPKHTHVMTAHEAVAATCTTAGTSAYWECTGCGKFFSDEDGNNEIGDIDAWLAEGGGGYVAPLGHNKTHYAAVAATFDAAGNIEYWYCDRCEKYFSDENCENEITQAQTVIPQKVAVAQIGSTKYESITDAITAAADGDTITVIADTTVPCYTTQITGKSITIDATGYTVTGTGSTTFPMFNVKATGGLTLAGGTFSNPGGIISNNGTAVVDGATLTAGGFAIQNKGALEVKSGTITASESAVTNGGENAKTTITGGTFTGKIKPANDGDGTIAISGGTFDRDVDIYAAPGYVGTQLSATTFGVKVDTNPLGLAPIVGFQKKAADDKYAQGVRIVTKVGDCDLTQFDEYGYVVVKVTEKQQATANFNNMKAYGGNGEKTIKCNGTVNTIDGLGEPYVTLAVSGMTDGQQVAARFYAIKDGVTYYSNYVSTARYNGIIAAY